MDVDEPPVPLPCAAVREIGTDITLQPPLSRRGHGPGLIIVLPKDLELDADQQTLDPPPRQKWAEEGYAVVEIQLSGGNDGPLTDAINVGIDALNALKECDVKDEFGLVCMCASVHSLSYQYK